MDHEFAFWIYWYYFWYDAIEFLTAQERFEIPCVVPQPAQICSLLPRIDLLPQQHHVWRPHDPLSTRIEGSSLTRINLRSQSIFRRQNIEVIEIDINKESILYSTWNTAEQNFIDLFWGVSVDDWSALSQDTTSRPAAWQSTRLAPIAGIIFEAKGHVDP